MEPVEWVAWQMQPSRLLGFVALTWLACWVALGLARRVTACTGGVRRAWLGASALALGTGLWAGHFIVLSSEQLPIALAYGGWLSLAGWAVAVAAALAGFAVAGRRKMTPSQAALAGLVLAIGQLGAAVLCFLDLRMAPALEWQPFWAATAVLATSFGGAACCLAGPRLAGLMGRTGGQALTALLLAGTLAAGHRCASLAAQLDPAAVSLHHLSGIAPHSMALLAGIGTAALLGGLLVVCVVESHLRRALQRAVETLRVKENTDPLTQLANRQSFEHSLQHAALQVDRYGETMALLFVGLTGFRDVNESFGRHVGDLVH